MKNLSVFEKDCGHSQIEFYDKFNKYRKDRKLKRTHKNLMILEAGFVYCLRHKIEYSDNTFTDMMLSEDFNTEDGSEFDNLCKDLRMYRHNINYTPITISIDEYEACIREFGKE